MGSILKPQHIYLSLSITGLMLASVILFAHLTQAASIQVIYIQSLYWSLDNIWGIERALVNLIISISASAVAILATQKLAMRLTFKAIGVILIFTIGGFFLSIASQYSYQCCETPVVLHVGFPMSWGYAALGDFNELSYSAMGRYLQYFTKTNWHINLWGLVTDLLFWFNSIFLIVTMLNFKHALRFRFGKPG